MVVVSLFAKGPTCLNCLRRTFTADGAWVASAVRTQIRGKKTGRPQDHGVVVRLLEDIPKFGRKDAIFRIDRGRMRNLWYPGGKAEYMTTSRFFELGLSKLAIGERDPLFGTFVPREVEQSVDTDLSSIQIHTLKPERAAELLMSNLPETLTFARKPIHAQTAADLPTLTNTTPRSPLLAARAAVSTGSSAPEATPGNTQDAAVAPTNSLAIFGSVSTHDVAAAIRDAMRADPEAALIPIDGRDIHFIGMEEGVDRIKTLGRWEIDIMPGKATGVHPVRKVVEIVAEE